MIAAYEANEVAANLKFKDRRLSVYGVIAGIGTDIFGDPYISLTPDGSASLQSVQCMFPKSSAIVLAHLKKGQHYTVTGWCVGKLMNVLLKDCREY